MGTIKIKWRLLDYYIIIGYIWSDIGIMETKVETTITGTTL